MKQIRDEDQAIPHRYLPAGIPDSMPLTQKNLSLPQLVDEICLGLVAGAGPGAVKALKISAQGVTIVAVADMGNPGRSIGKLCVG